MMLSNAHMAFLEEPAPVRAGPLCDALAANGLDLEAHLLGRYIEGGMGTTRIDLSDSPWRDLRAHLGPVLPADAEAGDVWFDPYEVVPMILLPRPPLDPEEDVAPELLERLTPFVSWMALRPVAVWQYRTFLRMAPIAKRKTQIDSPFPLLDAERILQGGDTAPATRLTCSEATFYANWLGKSSAGLQDWEAAAAFLPGDAMHALWGPLRREWAGYSGFDESLCLVATPENFRLDPQDEADSDEVPPRELRMLYGEWAKPKGVGFRTEVSTQIGLLTKLTPDPFSFDNVFVRAPLPRSA